MSIFITNYNQLPIFLPNYNLYMIKDNSYYKLKYLKYKSKYINYKKSGGGFGDGQVIMADFPSQAQVFFKYNERHKVEQERLDQIRLNFAEKNKKVTELKQQIRSTYNTMYSNKDFPEDIFNNINLDLLITENNQSEKIQFIIFIKMEFRDLSPVEFAKIMEYVYNDQVFTKNDENELDGNIHEDVLHIIKKYIQDTLIPNIIINLLDESSIQKYEDIQRRICIEISRIDVQIKLYLPNTKLFRDLNCEETGSLSWISGMYIITNNELFNKLADSIEEIEDTQTNKGISKLNKFIKCIRSSDNITFASKKALLDMIKEALMPLHNEYATNDKCRRTGRWIARNLGYSIPQICYKYKHAKDIVQYVEKEIKILESEYSILEEKSHQYDIKRDELQKKSEHTNEELKSLLLQINSLFKKEYDELGKMLNDCLPEIQETNDILNKSQLADFLNKIEETSNFEEKQTHTANYNGQLARFNVDKCIPITSITTGLSKMLLTIEQNVNSLKKDFIKNRIPIIIVRSVS